MKLSLSPGCTLFLLCLACAGLPEEPPREAALIAMQFSAECRRVRSSLEARDLGDGTLRQVLTVWQPFCLLTGFRYTETMLVKKCLQGQVYRPDENDCRGVGTAANHYGASRLSYCPTDDYSCNTPSGPDPLLSPAGHSCYSDTTAGLEWRLLGLDVALNYGQLRPLLEITDSAVLWSDRAPTQDRATTQSIAGDGSIRTARELKSSGHFVLCAGHAVRM